MDGGDHVAAVVFVEDTVVTGTKLSVALFFLGGLDVAGAATRRARPVGVALPYDSAGLGSTPGLRGLVWLTLVGGNFRELGKRKQRQHLSWFSREVKG